MTTAGGGIVRTHPVFGPAGTAPWRSWGTSLPSAKPLPIHSLCLSATKFAPGEFVEPSTLRVRRLSPDLVQQTQKMPRKGAFFVSGGEGGIRTLGTAQHRTLTFQASPFDHSGTSPNPGPESYSLTHQPLRGVRSGLLRASCPPPLRGRLRYAAAFKFAPGEFVEPSVRLNTVHSIHGVPFGLFSLTRKRPAGNCISESPSATSPRRARSTTPAPLRNLPWKGGNFR
jgi:hypothetical protein